MSEKQTPNPDALAAEQPQPEALGYATRLATSLWEKHYKAVSPHWRPLNDTLGVLTQIDNMTCRLVPPPPAAEPTDEQSPPEAQPVAWREHVEQRIRSWRQRTMNRYGDRLAIDDYMSADAIDDLVDYVCDEYAAPPPSAPCPHIRSSGVGDHATHWCALNGPPAVPEPSEAQVEAAWRAIPASHEDSRVSVITKGDVWVMLRAAAAARNNNPA